MNLFPFTDGQWAEVESAACAITNATLADDTVLRESLLLELFDTLGKLREQYGEHPVLLETEADYEADPAEREAKYREAIHLAEENALPTITIRLSLAALLIDELHNAVAARRVLVDCQSELRRREDQWDCEQWNELMQKCDSAKAGVELPKR
jgi:hypothetical protein